MTSGYLSYGLSKGLYINPATIPTVKLTAGPTVSPDYLHADAVSVISTFFALRRGGYRIKLVEATPVTNDVCRAWLVTDSRNSTGRFRITAFNPASANDVNGLNIARDVSISNNPYSYQLPTMKLGMEVTVPMYNDLAASAVADSISNNSGFATSEHTAPRALAYFEYPTSTALKRVMIGGADDFNLSGFISIPPLYVIT